MVLRCSVLGHDFGVAETEREREERGAEVVVTVTEYEECARCGKRQVLSENTEVRAIDAPRPATDESDEEAREDGHSAVDEASGDATPTDAPDPAEDGASAGEDGVPTAADGTEATEATDDAVDDAEIIEEGPPAGEGVANELAESVPGDPATATADDSADDSADDAVILDEESASGTERRHGEWPSSDDVGPPVDGEQSPADWPDDREGGEQTEHSSTATEADASPRREGRETGSKQPVDDPAAAGSGIQRARSAPVPGEDPLGGGGPSELYCPACGYTVGLDRASLRPGDICSECRRGYLSQREQ